MGLGDYFSHYPILAAAVARTNGPVLELGCGDGSTPLLHYMCAGTGRYLLTADTNSEWLSKFRAGYYRQRLHEFYLVDQWKDFPLLNFIHDKWSVALVDGAPGEDRAGLALRLKESCTFIVCHDSERDYGTGANYRYEEITPEFKYVTEWRRYRPYTLVLSNEEPFPIEECDKVWDPKNV